MDVNFMMEVLLANYQMRYYYDKRLLAVERRTMDKLPPAFLGAAFIVLVGIIAILYSNGISWQSLIVCAGIAVIGIGRYL